jgi:hypothetical protein
MISQAQIKALPCTSQGDNPSLEKFKNVYIAACTNPALLANPITKVSCTGPSGLLFFGAKNWADKCDIKPTVAGPAPANATTAPTLPASPPQPNDPCQTTLKQQRDAWLQWCSDPFNVATKDAAYQNNCNTWSKGYEEFLSKCEANPFPDAVNKCPDLTKFKDAYAALCLDINKLRAANPLVKASCRIPDGQYYRGSKAYMDNCRDFIPKEVMDQPCDELYKSVVAKKSMCPPGPNDAPTVKLACREPDGMWQVLSRAWNKKGCTPPPAPTLPPAPTGMVRSDNENINAFTDWIYYWGDMAVKSKAVSPAYFPTYQSIMKIPPPVDNATPEQYNTYVDNVANIIYKWYAATDFAVCGFGKSVCPNIKVLKMNIENSKPRFKGPAPTAPPPPSATTPPPPEPSPPAPPNAPPTPDPRLKNLIGFTDFKQMYKNILDTYKDYNITEGFSQPTPTGPYFNLTSLISSLKSIAQDNILSIENLINGSPDLTVLTKTEEQLAKNKEQMIKTKDKLERNASAINQQFNDERGVQKVEKASKVMVLQDYILAAFTVSFAFFALVAIFYVVKQNEYSGKSMLIMTALMTVVAAILASWVLYMA